MADTASNAGRRRESLQAAPPMNQPIQKRTTP